MNILFQKTQESGFTIAQRELQALLLPQFPTVLERSSTTLYFPVPAPPSSKMAAMGQR